MRSILFAFAALMLAASSVTGAPDGDRGQAAGRENGWYRIIDGVADSIAPRPVLTVKEFAELRLDTNYFGNPIIIGRASRCKVRAWADSTDAITGHRLGFVVDGKVVTAPRVNSRIESGMFSIATPGGSGLPALYRKLVREKADSIKALFAGLPVDTLFGSVDKSRQDSLMSVIDYWDARATADALRGR